ncbi:MAG: formylglycine-generating enzyme family protein [Chthonomonadales bacterium]
MKFPFPGVAATLFIISCGALFCSPSAQAQSAVKKKVVPYKPKVTPKPVPVAQVTLKTITQIVPGSAAKIEMVLVPAGSVVITSADGKTKKTVDLKPYWIAKTETPWEVFDAFTISGPPSPAYDQTPFAPDAIARPSKSYIPPDMGWGHFGYPVIHESFLNASMFCRWLANKTGKKFRLPTEAEWEYACRCGKAAGTPMLAADIAKNAWTAGNSDRQTHPVGKKLPNSWGLFDMLGNVGEWVTDLNDKPCIAGGAFSDKTATVNPSLRAYMTRDWQETDPQIPKSRWWLSDAHFAGFRVICEE